MESLYENKFEKKIFLLLLSFLFTSCILFKNFECPYIITETEINSEAGNDAGLLEKNRNKLCFVFSNETSKTVESFEIVFSISFESEESENFSVDDSIYFASFSAEIAPFSSERFEINLDDNLNFIAETEFETECEIESIYAAKIIYADSSVWKDEYGIFAK